MTFIRFSILGTLAAVATVPATLVVQSPEPTAQPAAYWVGAAYDRLTNTFGFVTKDGGSPDSEPPRTRAAAGAPAQRDQSIPNADQPWDAPDWDEKVAAKILEKLVELPPEPAGTGTLQSVAGAQASVQAPALRQEQSWSSPPPLTEDPAPAPAARSSADLTPPVSPEANERQPIHEDVSQTAGLPTGQEEGPRVEAAPSQEPPSVPAAASVPSSDAEPEGAGAHEAGSAPRIANLPPEVEPEPDLEQVRSPSSEAKAVPLPPPRPATASAASESGKTASAQARAQQEESAKRVAIRYLESWSADNHEAIEELQRLSDQRIEYFGHSISKRAWIQKKRDFARTWPVRLYRHRPGSMSVECASGKEKCLVRATVDWETVSPSRGDFAAGMSKLELGIDFSGPQPRIDRESNLRIHARRNLPKTDDRLAPPKDQPEALEFEPSKEAFVD